MVPTLSAVLGLIVSCSPRPRGWSHPEALPEPGAILLPAPAGMVPRADLRGCRLTTAPRARGDGPSGPPKSSASANCSPRPRGWSLEGVGRGGTLRARTCSPRPRGWSRVAHLLGLPRSLLPAPAGMVPRRSSARAAPQPAPRARGDGPRHAVLWDMRDRCSPRPRGWSLLLRQLRFASQLLPAPAGMVPQNAG
ncbi:hypothetical protein SGLAU_32655 (plasmid) [Streptomyces glaucescens]|uniref:Uncharacterized protein n=1 Tax=Streptomyces glaucescens TaxID=1907 RepID=A0A089XER5_STRGA|nr:hypothetical protein SGLAU_32655 [Streptomyces glaucescens]